MHETATCYTYSHSFLPHHSSTYLHATRTAHSTLPPHHTHTPTPTTRTTPFFALLLLSADTRYYCLQAGNLFFCVTTLRHSLAFENLHRAARD